MPFKRLQTKILVPVNQKAEAETKSDGPAYTESQVYVECSYSNPMNGKLFSASFAIGGLGTIDYSFRNDHLYISHLSNTNKDKSGEWKGQHYQHVGTALIEFALRESMKRGKSGKIQLSASWQSHLFYFGMGFRALYNTKFVAGMNLKKDYLSYSSAKNEADKLQWQQKIKANQDYPSYEEDARKHLQRAAAAPVSFDEVLQHGFHDSVDAELQGFYDEQKATGKKHDFTSYGAVEMYLPAEAIASLKAKFHIEEKELASELQEDLSHAEFVIIEKNKIHTEKTTQMVADHKQELESQKQLSTLKIESMQRAAAAEAKTASDTSERRMGELNERLERSTTAADAALRKINLLRDAHMLSLNLATIINDLKHYVSSYESYTSAVWQFFFTHKESGRVYARNHLATWQAEHAHMPRDFMIEVNGLIPMTDNGIVQIYRRHLERIVADATEAVPTLPGTNVCQNSYRAYLLAYANRISALNERPNFLIMEVFEDVLGQRDPAPLEQLQAVMAAADLQAALAQAQEPEQQEQPVQDPAQEVPPPAPAINGIRPQG